MWDEVIDHLHAELYPHPCSAPKSDTLRTPQEFYAAFGRPALHEALIRLVRDQDHFPGESHRRMLQLPVGQRLHDQLGHFVRKDFRTDFRPTLRYR